jgi:hypothetical protein
MKAVRIFNPLHVLGNKISMSDIESFEERKDSNGKDTFDSSDWWKSNPATLPAFANMVRAVLTKSPNSWPPESLFSIFNATYNDDQKLSPAY